MKQIRRVVTGHSSDGSSIIASDSLVDGIEIALAPGNVFCQLWGSDESPHFPDDGRKPNYHTWFPPVGGFRLAHVTFPPDAPPPDMSGMTPDQIQAAMAVGIADAEAKVPGLLETMEPEHPGFHRSDTVDLLYVLSGELLLDLDGGRTVTVKAGDTVIGNGIRHAWRNPGSVPATAVVTIVGGQRTG